MVYCGYCGREITPRARFCPYCGMGIAPRPPPPVPSRPSHRKTVVTVYVVIAILIISLLALAGLTDPNNNGVGGNRNPVIETPTGSFALASLESNTTLKFIFGKISPHVRFTDCRLMFSSDGSLGTVTALPQTINGTGYSHSLNFVESDATYIVTLWDVAMDGTVDVGDYVVVHSSADLMTNQSYSASLVYGPTGHTIAETTCTVPV